MRAAFVPVLHSESGGAGGGLRASVRDSRVRHVWMLQHHGESHTRRSSGLERDSLATPGSRLYFKSKAFACR